LCLTISFIFSNAISRWFYRNFCVQDIEATVVSGNGTETGQIITTAIGGRDGQPKQVITLCLLHLYALFALVNDNLQTLTVVCYFNNLYNYNLLVSDNLIHGWTCCWDWFFWCRFSGIYIVFSVILLCSCPLLHCALRASHLLVGLQYSLCGVG